MKKVFLTALALIAFSVSVVTAQEIKMPQASTTQTIEQNFGLGKIKVNYSRPNVKGRKVFGGLVPYNEVWRTGANSSTIVTFSEDVELEGNKVAAGEYALFTIPTQNEWTIILNKDTKQWGAYTYKQNEDVLRFKVKSQKLKDKVETFTIQFGQVYPTTASMSLAWENTSVAINLKTEIDSKVMASIDEAMKGDKKPYFQAAQYYFENGKDLNKALEWVNEAEKQDNKAPWVKLWKSRIQLKTGDKQGAAVTAEAGIKAAKEANIEEYIRLNTQALAEAKK
ncbi:DUF2911 domain-containing protein [Rubrolithibacter danxiaensis]|uniref:DUF2911 domain-containing protein n=1 Tax=Rubrolithibacter danxiaensis TaxID=3390805 RepID=UPI003BF87667